MCRQDFKSNENALFKQINGLQQGAANANKNAKKNKGNMKEAADAAEQIRKWVSSIFKTSLKRLYPQVTLFWMKFFCDILLVSSTITRSLQILFKADLKLSTKMLTLLIYIGRSHVGS